MLSEKEKESVNSNVKTQPLSPNTAYTVHFQEAINFLTWAIACGHKDVFFSASFLTSGFDSPGTMVILIQD